MSDGARKAVDANERDGEGGIGGIWVCVDSVGEAMATAGREDTMRFLGVEE